MIKLFIIPALPLILLTSCSDDDTSTVTSADTPVSNKTAPDTKHDALMGYKSALDTAKSVTSAASENERKKQQAIEDAY